MGQEIESPSIRNIHDLDSFKDNLKAKLRDPIWQFVGAVVGILGVIAAIAFSQQPQEKPKAEPKPNILRIYSPTGSKSLTDFPNSVAARTRILIDGKDEKDVRYLVYIFSYDGERPIRTTDFEVPIRGAVPATRKIIAVQQSFETGVGVYKFGSNQISCEIQQTDPRNFEIKPLLMNPGDWFKIEIYSSALTKDGSAKGTPEKNQDVTLPDVSWSCRVAAVQCPETPPNSIDDIDLSAKGSGWDEPLQVTIRAYHGWSIYFLVLFTIFNFVLMVMLAKRTTLVQSRAITQLLLFACGIFLSMATAEILADWFFHRNTITEQPTFSTVLLLADAGALFWLGLRAAREKSMS